MITPRCSASMPPTPLPTVPFDNELISFDTLACRFERPGVHETTVLRREPAPGEKPERRQAPASASAEGYQFGADEMIAVQGSGGEQVLTVRFQTAGTKKLMAQLANLERVG